MQVDVQKRVNMFEMYGDVMTQVPTVAYALLAGSLSDKVWKPRFLSKIFVFPYCKDDQRKKARFRYLKYGRGLLLICPIIGQILEGAALLVNKIWFTSLPLEALWLAHVYDVMGGSAVWYLGRVNVSTG